ncbi:YcxB family protein [Streptomyces griseoluteus]|uniref:YcxB family protein n=1 Tax=Streptomyces griseoluteus TaxID=29306 RepID=UPI0036847FDF
MASVVAVAVFVILQIRTDRPPPVVFFGAAISAALAVRYSRTFLLLATPWGRRRAVRHVGDAPHEHEVSVDENGITLGADGRSRLEPWGTYTGYIETERQFILLQGSGEPTLTLPKRAFPDTALVAECRRLLEERLPARGRRAGHHGRILPNPLTPDPP